MEGESANARIHLQGSCLPQKIIATDFSAVDAGLRRLSANSTRFPPPGFRAC